MGRRSQPAEDDGTNKGISMPFVEVVLLQSDPGTMQSLIAPLQKAFRSVHEVTSLEDLRTKVAKYRTPVVILDFEMVSLEHLEDLSREHPAASIICNHRLADDEMWAVALSAGAVDCCRSSDTQSILQSAIRHAPMAHAKAA